VCQSCVCHNESERLSAAVVCNTGPVYTMVLSISYLCSMFVYQQLFLGSAVLCCGWYRNAGLLACYLSGLGLASQ